MRAITHRGAWRDAGEQRDAPSRSKRDGRRAVQPPESAALPSFPVRGPKLRPSRFVLEQNSQRVQWDFGLIKA